MDDGAKKRAHGALWAVLVGCLLTATAAMAGGDVKVNQDVGNSPQNETSITINRGWGGNVVVGYNDVPGTANGLGIDYSFDSGVHWTDSQTQTIWGIEGDPSVASDLLGNVFAGMSSYGNGPLVFPNNGVYVSRSTNGGATWGTPKTIDQYVLGATPVYFTDKDYIATDTYPGSPYANNVYIVWQRDNANGVNADIYCAWSNDHGVTFNNANGTPIGRISDLPSVPGSPPVRSSNANGAVPAVAPDGTVYVAWQDAPLCTQSLGQIFVDKSTDGGQTWGNDVVATTYNTCARYPKGGNSFQVRSFPSIAVSPVKNGSGNYDVYVVYSADPDRQNETSIESDPPGVNLSQTPRLAYAGSNVYSVWVDGRNNASNNDIYFNRSTNNGVTWGTDVRINTGVAAGSATVFNPRIAADLSSVYVVWEDLRNGKDDIYCNVSSDGGTTWLPSSVRLDTGTSPGADNSWLPEITAAGSNVYVVWCDDRSGDGDLLFNHSTNGGATWQAAATRIDNAPANVWSSGPKISCQGSDVYVTWWDGRNGYDDIFFNHSADGGATWQASDTRLDGGLAESSDQCICSTGSHVYVAWRDQRNGLDDVYFNSSANNGATWQASDTRLDVGDPPGASISSGIDLACSGNNVYAVWSDDRNGQQNIYYNVSTNGGGTWGTDARVEADFIPGAHAAAGAHVSTQGSNVYVAYLDWRFGTANLYFRYSMNNGATWYGKDIRLDAGDLAGVYECKEPQIASTGPYVYVVWPDARNGMDDIYFNCSANYGVSWRDGPDDGDIMLVRSVDGGATWGAPVRVNDDTGTCGQFQPWVKVKPNGIIDVAWYDRRHDPINDSFMEVYMGASNDRGMTFANRVVSDVIMRPGAAPMVWPWPWMGEYLGLDVDATDAYIVWTDTRTPNDLDIYFDRFENPLTTGIGEGSSSPRVAYLEQNVPNPFNPVTTISFGLARRGAVSLCVYDVSGRVVRVLVDGVRPPGRYREAWDGRDAAGTRVASGVYFYRLMTPGFDEARKMVLLK